MSGKRMFVVTERCIFWDRKKGPRRTSLLEDHRSVADWVGGRAKLADADTHLKDACSLDLHILGHSAVRGDPPFSRKWVQWVLLECNEAADKWQEQPSLLMVT